MFHHSWSSWSYQTKPKQRWQTIYTYTYTAIKIIKYWEFYLWSRLKVIRHFNNLKKNQNKNMKNTKKTTNQSVSLSFLQTKPNQPTISINIHLWWITHSLTHYCRNCNSQLKLSLIPHKSHFWIGISLLVVRYSDLVINCDHPSWSWLHSLSIL